MKTRYTYPALMFLLMLLALLSVQQLSAGNLRKDKPLSAKASLKAADLFYKQYKYREAAASYQEALKAGSADKKFYITRQIAKTYRAMFDYDNAVTWYGKLMDYSSDVANQDIYEYAQLLKSVQNYDKAMEVYELYAKKAGLSAADVETFRASCLWAKTHMNDKPLFNLSPTTIQTGGPFLGADYYNAGFIVAQPQMPEPMSVTAYSDLQYVRGSDSVNFGKGEKLPGRTNGLSNEAQPSLSADGKTMYFVKNTTDVGEYNPKKAGSMPVNADGVSLVGIYVSYNRDGEWTRPAMLSFNSTNYSCTYPFIDKDGKTLYFASNKPGGSGGFDIYKATLQNDSVFSEPVNLGRDINSADDDFAPRVYHSTFYYASRGKGGFGGADLFAAGMDAKTGRIEKPQNMGIPFNSPKDDFYILFRESKKEGYLASNREGGHGVDKLYYFKKIFIPDTLDGTIRDRITNYPLKDVKVELYEIKEHGDSAYVDATSTNKDGYWEFLIDPEKRYKTHFTLNDYEPKAFTLLAVGDNGDPNRDRTIGQMRNIRFSPVVKKNKIIKIDNIYFDFNKADIRSESYSILNNLLEFLNENPAADVELSAHTDAVGSDAYNIKLSNGRARSCFDYLTSKGIDPKRIVPKGYGESHLLNNCKDAKKCSEEENQLNRRVEVKFL